MSIHLHAAHLGCVNAGTPSPAARARSTTIEVVPATLPLPPFELEDSVVSEVITEVRPKARCAKGALTASA
jgi:hypothetical protein